MGDVSYEDCEDEINDELNLYLYIDKFKVINSRLRALDDLYYFLLNYIEDERITHGKMYYEDDILNEAELGSRIFIALLINLLQIFEEKKEHFGIGSSLLFSYQPPDIFNRISNQKGLFIYQSYISYKCPVYDYQYLCKQHIEPDIVIEVVNHESILEELDYLGINLEAIYGDYDNISKYIKSKYEKFLI